MISVCLATHNGEKYIGAQLDSILSQIESNDEVVISDDGSTDNTIAIIKSLGDNRIRLFRYVQPRKSVHPHEYISKNFENAIIHSKGDYIFLSDQDDIWDEHKVRICLSYLQKYNLIVHDMQFIDNQLNRLPWGGIMAISDSIIGCRQAPPIMDA